MIETYREQVKEEKKNDLLKYKRLWEAGVLRRSGDQNISSIRIASFLRNIYIYIIIIILTDIIIKGFVFIYKIQNSFREKIIIF